MRILQDVWIHFGNMYGKFDHLSIYGIVNNSKYIQKIPPEI